MHSNLSNSCVISLALCISYVDFYLIQYCYMPAILLVIAILQDPVLEKFTA